jgi:hypothetical protein
MQTSPSNILNRESVKPSSTDIIANQGAKFHDFSILSSDDSIEMRKRRKENMQREFSNLLQTNLKDQYS